MKKVIANQNALAQSCLSWDVCRIIEDILARLNPIEDDAEVEWEDVWQAMDDELIYTADQWKVVVEYSDGPECPLTISEACERLADDIAGFIDYETIEEATK